MTVVEFPVKPQNAPPLLWVWLSLMGVALGLPTLQAQEPITASTQHVAISTGNYQKLENAVTQADAIFIGEVSDPGSEALLPKEAMNEGHLYRGVEINLERNLLGLVSGKLTVSVYVSGVGPARFLATKMPSIFFLQTHYQNWPCYPFNQLGKDDARAIVIKVIPATDDQLAEVAKLISALTH
jgi:hypothetical protein